MQELAGVTRDLELGRGPPSSSKDESRNAFTEHSHRQQSSRLLAALLGNLGGQAVSSSKRHSSVLVAGRARDTNTGRQQMRVTVTNLQQLPRVIFWG